MSDQILNGWEIESISIHYENLLVRTSDERTFFISPVDLVEAMKEGNFQIVHKRTRAWLKPIKVDDVGNVHLTDEDNYPANANLIAAAPDMLEALKEIRDWCDTSDDGDPIEMDYIFQPPWYQELRIIIAKAEGKT